MFHFFAYMSRMKHIMRWGLMRNTETENIKEHSLDVAMVAHALAVIRNTYFNGTVDENRVMTVAAYHEAGEVITGDLATPIKYYNPQIKDEYKKIEGLAVDKLLGMLPTELRDTYDSILKSEEGEIKSIVKAADKLCAYIKCIEESKSGNMEFSRAQVKIKSDLEKIDLPELKYFMENMLPSYELTLDELN